MCDEARGCRPGTPERVIFAEYVRFNRAIVKKKPQHYSCVCRFPGVYPAKISVRKSGFPREAKETHGAVFGNRPRKSKRSPKKAYINYIGAGRMGEILKGGKNNGSKGKDPCQTEEL